MLTLSLALALAVAGLYAGTSASPTADNSLVARDNAPSNPYAPESAFCAPSWSPLVRPATSLNPREADYVQARKQKADQALSSWLQQHGNFSTDSQPSVGFASSGGGFRSLLVTAGVVQSFDGRDSTSGTAGLYQGLTYESGLSGGAWFLSSFAGSNWQTVSWLQANIWNKGLAECGLDANNLLSDSARYSAVVADLQAKQNAGSATTLVDPYGRILSYAILNGTDGGVTTRLSGLASLGNFTDNNVPFPIVTARGIDNSYVGKCSPVQNSTEYEFTPFEYGSWDSGVSAFAPTIYMGTKMENGRPLAIGSKSAFNPRVCTQGYDNLGYVLGTSSDLFNLLCNAVQPANSTSASIWSDLSDMVNVTHPPVFQDIFGLYNNPFYKYPRSSRVNQHDVITMTDGGQAGQNIPIWPFLQPSPGGKRDLDVLLASDASSDTNDNFPAGTSLLNTYFAANNQTDPSVAARMPYIPAEDTFIFEGLNKRATFFGCNASSPTALMIVYLPNVAYSFPSNQSTFKLLYNATETAGMIENGAAIGSQNGDENWPTCLACAIKHKDSDLPSECNACFQKYCYYKIGTSGG